MVDRDPIDDLRAAWGAVTPPPPDCDAQTAALVDDLRAVWNTLEVPESSPNALRLRLQLRARASRLRDRATLAAAASLLIALVVSALHAGSERRPEDQLATHELTEPAAPDVAADPRVRYLAPEVRASMAQDGAVELRHGRVRLLLGGGTTTTTITTTDVQPARTGPEGQ